MKKNSGRYSSVDSYAPTMTLPPRVHHLAFLIYSKIYAIFYMRKERKKQKIGRVLPI